MKTRAKKIIEQLAKPISKLPEPIHLIAICSGGRGVAKVLKTALTKKRIKVNTFETWVDSVKGRGRVFKNNFQIKDYIGTAVIIDDVVWAGHLLDPVKVMVKKMNPNKKFYTAVILDCNNKADFAVFK